MKKKIEFSKLLLIQESILVWVVTIFGLYLAGYALANQCYGEMPWIATIIACPWTAYGATQGFYYKKSEKENTKDGIKFETVMAQLEKVESSQENATIDYEEAAG